jgi:hypothetical protein
MTQKLKDFRSFQNNSPVPAGYIALNKAKIGTVILVLN